MFGYFIICKNSKNRLVNISSILEEILWLMNILEEILEEIILVGEYSGKYFWKRAFG